MFWTLFTFWIIFLLRVLITQRSSTCDRLTVSASVSTMAGQQIRMLKPVYLRNRDIQCKKDAQITDYDLVGAVGSKITDIKCIQRDRDLWRIYVNSRESRNILVAEGFELGKRTISVFDTNPFSAGTARNFGLQRQISWKFIYIQKISKIFDKNVAEFNYKLLHNLLSNRYLVSKWNRDVDNKCISCNDEIENNMHLLYDCQNIRQIWKLVSNCLKFDIGWKHVIIGFLR